MDRRRKILGIMGLTDNKTILHPKQVLVEIWGNRRVLIENHAGVLGYTSNEICVATHGGAIHISGSGLKIQQITNERLIITGCVKNIQLPEVHEK